MDVRVLLAGDVTPALHPVRDARHVSPLHVTSLMWCPGGMFLALAVGTGNVLVLSRAGDVVHVTPSPLLSRTLQWSPPEPPNARPTPTDVVLSMATSAFVPVCNILARHAVDKKAPSSGVVSLWPHANGSHLLCFDGNTLVQLKLPAVMVKPFVPSPNPAGSVVCTVGPVSTGRGLVGSQELNLGLGKKSSTSAHAWLQWVVKGDHPVLSPQLRGHAPTLLETCVPFGAHPSNHEQESAQLSRLVWLCCVLLRRRFESDPPLAAMATTDAGLHPAHPAAVLFGPWVSPTAHDSATAMHPSWLSTPALTAVSMLLLHPLVDPSVLAAHAGVYELVSEALTSVFLSSSREFHLGVESPGMST